MYEQHKMTAVLKNAGVMHFIYYVNRLTTTKVDSTYLAVNQQCITYNLQDNLQDLLLIAILHGQYDQNCLASIVVVLLPV